MATIKKVKSDISAIDKIRIVINWANYMNEGFNERFRKISDIEKVYDYCQSNNLEFCDGEYFMNADFEVGEILTHQTAINKLLRYKLYNI
jgi:hypothetical protein